MLDIKGESLKYESVAFSIGSYDVANDKFRLLYEVPTIKEIDYEAVKLAYDKESGNLYFSAGEAMFEVVLSD